MTDAYSPLAPIYDAVVGETTRELAGRAVGALRGLGLPPGARVLDLGCGTGISTVALAEAGWVPRGVDASPAMIAAAQALAAAAHLELALEVGDLARLEVDAPADAAVCLHDVLNHLAPGALPAALARVHRALRPGAPFVLDVNLTPGGRALSGTSFRFDLGDTFVTFEIETVDREMAQRATLFHRASTTEGELWRREDHTLRHHLFLPDEVERELVEAGFTLVETAPIDLVDAWVLKQLIVCTA